MATLLATATLEINVTIGELYVRDDYVVLEYVEGGIVAQDLDLATSGTIAITATITTTAVYAPGVVSATLSITSTIDMGPGVFDIEADPYNTFILSKEIRLNTVEAETRSFVLQNESRSFNVKPEQRIYNILKETRNFKIKRPAIAGIRRKDTVNVWFDGIFTW